MGVHVKEHHGRFAVGSELYGSSGRGDCCRELTLYSESVHQLYTHQRSSAGLTPRPERVGYRYPSTQSSLSKAHKRY